MKKLLHEPLLHFLALGAVLFAFHAWRENGRTPETLPARIEVNAAVIERLRAAFERQFSKPPTEEEMRGQITAHIREEVYCREALALGLDRDDTIVRRRLAQKMEFLTGDLADAVTPGDADLNSFFEKNAASYARPGSVSFRHVYFSKEKHPAGLEAAAASALADLNKGVSDATLGNAFLHGYEFAKREQADIGAAFGEEFAKKLASLPTDSWQGPVASSYGLHLVRVEARSEPYPAKLNEVRMAVLRDFNEERRQTLNREVFERLRQRYDIAVDEAALKQALNQSRSTAQR